MNTYCEFDVLKNLNKKLIVKKNFKNNISLTRININSKNLARDFNKEMGLYSSIFCKKIEYDNKFFNEISKVLIRELNFYISNTNILNPKFFIVGLGNPEVPADKLGYLTSKKIISTANLISKNKITNEYFSTVFSLSPSVESINGLSTAKIVKSMCKDFKPDIVILIDAMTCNNLKYMGKTIQVSSSGLTPGGEISKENIKIDKNLLKIPVVSIGCPFVISSKKLIKNEVKEEFLTSKDVLTHTNFFCKVLSYSLNKSIHKKLSKEEIFYLINL